MYSSESEMSDVEEEDGGMGSRAAPAGDLDAAGSGKKEKMAKKREPGVVYLSRVPPYMKPHKLKHLLYPYGNIGHVFLQPEGECPAG